MQATATTFTGSAPVGNVLGIVAALPVAASMACEVGDRSRVPPPGALTMPTKVRDDVRPLTSVHFTRPVGYRSSLEVARRRLSRRINSSRMEGQLRPRSPARPDPRH
jgi:hypothetical protein